MAGYKCYCTMFNSGLIIILSFATIYSYHGIYYVYENVEIYVCQCMYLYIQFS